MHLKQVSDCPVPDGFQKLKSGTSLVCGRYRFNTIRRTLVDTCSTESPSLYLCNRTVALSLDLHITAAVKGLFIYLFIHETNT